MVAHSGYIMPWPCILMWAALFVFVALLACVPAARAQVGAGGGQYLSPPNANAPLTDAQRAEVWAGIEQNREILLERGLLPSLQERAAASAPLLSWPLEAVDGFPDYGYHGVSGFMDHDSGFPNFLLDYACGRRTYDTVSGYNHKGVDFFLWPLPWAKMDAGVVQIVSAAEGVIVGKRDGEFDRSCSPNSNPWNAVYVEHADGSVAWYGHMKKNSVTEKTVGSPVDRGEVLGLVGSSGNSTGPHLHFELYDSGRNLVDPYSGDCNVITSWWVTQRNYYDSTINKLATGSTAPTAFHCEGADEPTHTTRFTAGDVVYFTAYYRDQRGNQSSTYTVYRSDGSVFATWDHSSVASHYNASYWYWRYALPIDAQEGTWRFEVSYQGNAYHHSFDVETQEVSSLSSQALLALCSVLLAMGLGYVRISAR